ncbi:MAG: D-2-hydroxyacid dehydrogenase family protein [Gammaproteobacteria bacterium]|nr:D-2-hydroxyacid dehydrogenase family protein [Gammaproteobacteria bacterium]
MTRVALLDDYQGVAMNLAPWANLGAAVEVVPFHDHLDDEAALIERLASFDVIMAMRERTPFPRSLFAALPNLKLLVTAGMRNASIDMQAAADHGVTVCGTGGLPTPTAELAWGLILSLMRFIPREDAATRAGSWETTVGLTLHGKRLGVVGLGRLGAQVAKVGVAFGMDVVAWSQNLTAERAAEIGVRRVDKEELLQSSDVISVHLVLSERSRGLIGAAELALMKSTAFIVNTSRGPIIDETALVGALRDGTIAGAGLDTFDVEPLPTDHPLLKLDNTVITPHLGYVTDESLRVFYEETLEDIQGFLAGSPVRVLST